MKPDPRIAGTEWVRVTYEPYTYRCRTIPLWVNVVTVILLGPFFAFGFLIATLTAVEYGWRQRWGVK